MEEGSGRSGGALAGQTLGAVLGNEKETPPPHVNRTLLDIIQAEELNSKAYKNLIDHHHNKKSWKSLKDRLRLKRAGAAWAAAVASTSLDIGPAVASESNQRPPLAQLLRIHSVHMVEPVHEDHLLGDLLQAETNQVQLLNRSLSRVVSLRTDLAQDSFHVEQVQISDVPDINNLSSLLRQNSSLSGQSDDPVRTLRLSEALAAEREQIQRVVSSNEAVGSARGGEEVPESANDNGESGAVDEQQQVRMSLMDLLEETERQVGWSSSSYARDVDDVEDGKNAEMEGNNLVEGNCCVCMVRDKGSAFIPCGHTFCRLCSRELWVNRGNCPLCNGFILEILDIF